MTVISVVAEKYDYRIFQETIFSFSESLRNMRRAAKKVGLAGIRELERTYLLDANKFRRSLTGKVVNDEKS